MPRDARLKRAQGRLEHKASRWLSAAAGSDTPTWSNRRWTVGSAGITMTSRFRTSRRASGLLAPGVWLIANLANALLLATSNRSEAAVGYATMDGDTCGGISPIAGIDKAFLRRWLIWLERVGPVGRGPIPELVCVNALSPSAELRPLEQRQTDEEDLMPYEVLDAIEDEAIGRKRSPAEALASLSSRFVHHREEDLRRWVARFYALWCRNQWKRERYAPSFHVDDKNLDPKTWCRFPILSGGFRRELRELEGGQGA